MDLIRYNKLILFQPIYCNQLKILFLQINLLSINIKILVLCIAKYMVKYIYLHRKVAYTLSKRIKRCYRGLLTG